MGRFQMAFLWGVCILLTLSAVSCAQECQIKGTITCKETTEKLSEVIVIHYLI